MAVKKKAAPVAKNKSVKKRAARARPAPEAPPVPAPAPMAQPPDGMLRGRYANTATISHTPREFVLDFSWDVDQHPILVSRVITSPAHAKELLAALAENVASYERKYGRIVTGSERAGETPVH